MTDSSSPSIHGLVRSLTEVRIVRFVIVGVSNTARLWHLRAANILMPAFGAQRVSYAISMLWSYHWNRRWIFQSQDNVAGEASRFFTTQIAFMLLSSAALGYPCIPQASASFAVLVGTVAIITVWNFFWFRATGPSKDLTVRFAQPREQLEHVLGSGCSKSSSALLTGCEIP